ncbi:hypothetical protein CEUSTIGMA_g5973.t1 [Chlamydomonas eustigma]|uniref:Uncharacterized protein n=1 Tax=Chlamydomonas eustigma TaxID=1157962 RepID=A0A250X626_9CHLO|nr:hypothetical protein CEUSTIGMA_g5973.t1 [Chlamydomonas eustigma]|eukprot:GAX78533.1 hypothetical protein CEUSTIGMA_g5973.t1 [Chlamydomonas eustigma]
MIYNRLPALKQKAVPWFNYPGSMRWQQMMCSVGCVLFFVPLMLATLWLLWCRVLAAVAVTVRALTFCSILVILCASFFASQAPQIRDGERLRPKSS